jgi:ribonuclease D
MTTWITSHAELEALVRCIRSESVVAIDTESDSLHHYREKVCLVQVGRRNAEPVLVDPLALMDLSPLAALAKEMSPELVFHGADYDVACLKRDFAFSFGNLFDTMIASRLLGEVDFGLSACLLRELGVHVSKDERLADWSLRPLDPLREAYALADVEHLVALRDRLVDRLREAGREAWVREECAAVAALPAAVPEPEPADFRKSSACPDLNPRGLAVLKSLYEAREAICRATDRPRYKVAGDRDLAVLALGLPHDAGELERLRGVPRNILRRPGPWLDAIRRGLSDAPVQLDPPPSRPRTDPRVAERIGRLRAWRPEVAARLRLDQGVLLPQRLIVALAVDDPRDRDGLERIEGLRSWRVDALGNEILKILSGKTG